MNTEEDPKKALGLRLAHVGINGGTPENAEKITRQLATLLGLGTTELAPSYFVDTYIEIMKGAGRGEKGHIGFHVDDLPTAEAWFAARGFEVNESSRTALPNGSHLVYFTEPIAGFAIHLTDAD